MKLQTFLCAFGAHDMEMLEGGPTIRRVCLACGRSELFVPKLYSTTHNWMEESRYLRTQAAEHERQFQYRAERCRRQQIARDLHEKRSHR